MNITVFLKEVDKISSGFTKEQLADALHEIARRLDETERRDFLKRLKGTEKAESGKIHAEIIRKHKSLKEQLEKIKSCELTLQGELNQEYDEWYSSDDEEFIYSDPDGVLDILEEAGDFLHQCVDSEEYEAGYDIARHLVGLEIMVDGEYQEYTEEPVRIDELSYYKLGNLDYRRLVIDGVHAAYCASGLSDRSDAVYTMLEMSKENDITMETVMQSGWELPESQEFLRLWAGYLAKKKSARAEKMLGEALELVGDEELILEKARSYCQEHPGLYEQYILGAMGRKDSRELLAVGREALEAVDRSYVARGRIALLTSRLALEQGLGQEAEACWLEAFRSDTRVVNYMRLAVESEDFSQLKEAAKSIYQDMYVQIERNPCGAVRKGELTENCPGRITVCMLAFLGGDFEYVRDRAMNEKGAVGWSMTFMKCGLAAFLLLLFEEENLNQGCAYMCGKVVEDTGFSSKDYEQGILGAVDDSSREWFWKCFCRWKKMMSVTEEEKLGYLKWVERLVARRVKGIMDGNHRNYYGECAAYVAALGEVRESRGEANGKQKAMVEYKGLYSRRSAFHGELRAMGMKG